MDHFSFTAGVRITIADHSTLQAQTKIKAHESLDVYEIIISTRSKKELHLDNNE